MLQFPGSLITMQGVTHTGPRTADSPMLTFTPLLLDGCRLLCTTTYSAMTRLFVLVLGIFGLVVSTIMYISALPAP